MANSDTESLQAWVRTQHGSAASRRLRRMGRLPAVLYGKGEPLSLELDMLQAERSFQAMHGGERLISLQIEGSQAAGERQVLVRQIDTAPLKQRLLHVDFHQIDLSTKVRVAVEVKSYGKAAGELHGGLLQTVMHEVLVECLPSHIPEYVKVDISPLNIGDSIHVRDLQLPEGVSVASDKEETVFVMQAPRKTSDIEDAVDEAETAEIEADADLAAQADDAEK